ncbi:Hypothetical predicted protein, partial [Paramuricea clavata]
RDSGRYSNLAAKSLEFQTPCHLERMMDYAFSHDISLTTEEVLNALLALDPDKATLKETAQQIAPSLTGFLIDHSAVAFFLTTGSVNALLTKVFKCVDSISDAGLRQSDLSSLGSWSTNSGLVFNQEKCKLLRIIRKKNPIEFLYVIKRKTLDISLEEKDLGIWVTGALIWSKHTFDCCAKANKLLAWFPAQICCGNQKSKHPPHAVPDKCLSCIRLTPSKSGSHSELN